MDYSRKKNEHKTITIRLQVRLSQQLCCIRNNFATILQTIIAPSNPSYAPKPVGPAVPPKPYSSQSPPPQQAPSSGMWPWGKEGNTETCANYSANFLHGITHLSLDTAKNSHAFYHEICRNCTQPKSKRDSESGIQWTILKYFKAFFKKQN